MNWTPKTFDLRELIPGRDVAVFHPWFDLPYASYWDMAGMSRQAVLDFYEQQHASEHEWAFVGTQDGEIRFLLECYDPAHHAISGHYEIAQGDVGMHFFVAPATQPRHGYTLDVMRHVMHHLFNAFGARRVVVEPDIRNENVRVLNRRAGFSEIKPIELSTKRAMLSLCTPPDFYATL